MPFRRLLHKFNRSARRLSTAYAVVSTANPFKIAAATSMSILTAADLTCQSLEALSSDNWREAVWDWRRTLSLTVFGLLYYGGPCKFLYLRYDQVFRNTLPGNIKKTCFDACVHTPFMLVPSFYFITGPIKGMTVQESAAKLKKQWFEASTGSIAFWLPTCLINFWLVPQHSRILVVSIMSFFHKTWLSWVSNRKEKAMRAGDETVGPPLNLDVPVKGMIDGDVTISHVEDAGGRMDHGMSVMLLDQLCEGTATGDAGKGLVGLQVPQVAI